jgi:integrase
MLTELEIRSAKPAEKVRKLSDERGLQLWILPSGSKLWRLAYRHLGKQKVLAFGSYPEVTLKEARERRDGARKTLAAGTDPAEKKKLDRLTKAAAAGNTFDVLADEWLAKVSREGRAEATLGKVTWLLSLARPALGKRPIAEISALEMLDTLRTVERRGRLESARRLRSTVSCVFRFAIATGRAENDPTVPLRGALAAPVAKHRAAVTDPGKFGGLLRAIDGFDGQSTTKIALQLLALTAVRPGELRQAGWNEFDLDKAKWIIPEGRTKMRRAHEVPLPRQAVELLRSLWEITGGSRYLFPSIRSSVRCMSENTLNAALRRLGYDKDEACSHGFRSSFSTIANESGKWSADAIERALAHVDGNDIRRAYHRGAHWSERVELAQWWADRCDELRRSTQVIPLRASQP